MTHQTQNIPQSLFFDINGKRKEEHPNPHICSTFITYLWIQKEKKLIYPTQWMDYNTGASICHPKHTHTRKRKDARRVSSGKERETQNPVLVTHIWVSMIWSLRGLLYQSAMDLWTWHTCLFVWIVVSEETVTGGGEWSNGIAYTALDVILRLELFRMFSHWKQWLKATRITLIL